MIEVLYFAGCPNREPAVTLARDVARALRVDDAICEVEVATDADAERLRFLGSPTVRVDGVDIDPEAATQTDYSLSCRMYGSSGVPSRDLLVRALEARGGPER
jgi:hypothetical protein